MKPLLQRLTGWIRKSNWFDLRTLLISLVLLILASSSLAWVHVSEPRTVAAQNTPVQVQLTPTPKPALQSGPTPTLLPPEYLTNSGQTTGIVLVSALMVLIVVGGVFYTLLKERNENK